MLITLKIIFFVKNFFKKLRGCVGHSESYARKHSETFAPSVSVTPRKNIN